MKSWTYAAGAAVLACCAVGAHAQSSVSLYGQIDMWAGSTRVAGQSGAAAVVNPSGMQTSYWGMKTVEHLSGDVDAIATVEGFYRGNDGGAGRFDGDAMFARSAWVGLASRTAGTLRLGRNTNPFYIAVVATNPFADSPTFSPALLQTFVANRPGGAPILGDTGWSNAIVYVSPSLGPISATGIYAVGGTPGRLGDNKAGAVLNYADGRLTAALGYQQVKYGATPGDQGSAFQRQQAALLGLAYDFRWLKAYGQLLRVVDSRSTADTTKTVWQLGMSIPVGAGAVLASYAHTSADNFIQNQQRTQRNTWAIGFDYNLSKRTDVYVACLADHIEGMVTGYTAGAGMRHHF